MKNKSVQQFLNSTDPLSQNAFEFLLNYKEEDHLVDYKVDFEFQEEKEWLEVTKDIMAFANTYGGYLIFGVCDGTFSVEGLNESTTQLLADTDKLLQKINRFLDPPIRILRSKKFIADEKQVVGIFVPASVGVTHVISKDGSFKYPSGKVKLILRKGTIYVRRSAGNALASARDIDNIFNRRLEIFKESLLDKITQVVEAPIESELVLISQDANIEADKKFIIDDSSGAVPIKGMSFTTPPKTPEQEIAAWIALFSKYKTIISPPDEVMWGWYKNRNSIKLSEKHRVTVAELCILSTNVPPFFWLQDCNAKFIKEMINDAMENKSSALQTTPICETSAFLGKRFYDSVVKSISSSKTEKEYPSKGPKSAYNMNFIEALRNKNRYSEKQLRASLEDMLDEIASKLQNRREERREENYNMLIWRAQIIDCYLYAPDNKYK